MVKKNVTEKGFGKRLKLKKKDGEVVDLPASAIKSILSKAGYTGKHLVLMTTGVLRESAHLASSGVITVIQLEKAILLAFHNTNSILMDNTKDIVKKILHK